MIMGVLRRGMETEITSVNLEGTGIIMLKKTPCVPVIDPIAEGETLRLRTEDPSVGAADAVFGQNAEPGGLGAVPLSLEGSRGL